MPGYFSRPEKIRMILFIHAAMFSVAMVVYCAYYYTHLQGYIDIDNNVVGRDFAFFWRALQLLKSGDVSGIYSSSVYAREMQEQFGRPLECTWPYPPYFLLVLLPFTFFTSYKAAYAAWMVFQVVALLFALCWRQPLPRMACWIAFTAPMLLLTLFVGQNMLLITALFIGGFRLLPLKPGLAGVLLALVSLKPQLAILLPFMLLALRQYRAFMTMALTFCLLAGASVLCFGVQNWRDFFVNLSALTGSFPGGMMSLYAGFTQMGLSDAVALRLQSAIGIIVIAMLCLRLGEMRGQHWTNWLKLAVPATYLVTPYEFIYNMCLFNLFWVVWCFEPRERTMSSLSNLLWLLLWYLPIGQSYFSIHHLPVIPAVLLLTFMVEYRLAISSTENLREG